MGKYTENKIRAVRMDKAEDSLDKVEDKICELSSSLDDVRQAVLDLEIKVNQQACKGERTEDELPRIPYASKSTIAAGDDIRRSYAEPVPELRPQVGEIVERANADRLHIKGLAIIDSNHDIARWDGEWSYTGNDVGVDDDDIWWPVMVLLPS